jgi:hypothetical protein
MSAEPQTFMFTEDGAISPREYNCNTSKVAKPSANSHHAVFHRPLLPGARNILIMSSPTCFALLGPGSNKLLVHIIFELNSPRGVTAVSYSVDSSRLSIKCPSYFCSPPYHEDIRTTNDWIAAPIRNAFRREMVSSAESQAMYLTLASEGRLKTGGLLSLPAKISDPARLPPPDYPHFKLDKGASGVSPFAKRTSRKQR